MKNLWYVTAGSGGVWKTENSGTTWNPIFDSQKKLFNWMHINGSAK